MASAAVLDIVSKGSAEHEGLVHVRGIRSDTEV